MKWKEGNQYVVTKLWSFFFLYKSYICNKLAASSTRLIFRFPFMIDFLNFSRPSSGGRKDMLPEYISLDRVCRVCSQRLTPLFRGIIKDVKWIHIHPHCAKSVRMRSFSGLYFSAFGLNTKRYRVNTNKRGHGIEPWRTINMIYFNITPFV